MIVDEPVIGEHYNFTLEPPHSKVDCVLNEQAAETLRAEEARDLLSDIFVGGGIDDFDFGDGIDFSELMDGEENAPIGGAGGGANVGSVAGGAQTLAESPLSTVDAAGRTLHSGADGGKLDDPKSVLKDDEYDDESLSKQHLNA